MFQMREKYEECVNVDSIASEMLENVLDFVYTGNIAVTEENVSDLLAIAEFTDIPSKVKFLKYIW